MKLHEIGELIIYIECFLVHSTKGRIHFEVVKSKCMYLSSSSDAVYWICMISNGARCLLKNKINWWNLKQTHKRAERRIDKVNRIRNITMTIQSRYQWGKRVILRSFGWHYPFDTSFVVNFQLQAPNSIKTNAFNACLHISSMCICSICFIFFLSEYFEKKKIHN